MQREADYSKVKNIAALVGNSGRWTIDENSNSAGLSHGTLFSVLTDELKMSKVCAKWVSSILNDDQEAERVTESQIFLRSR